MQVVILCGGKGTRMGKEEVPKPLFTIGTRPILWHIMNIYASQGFKDFILCLGYQGDKIKNYCRTLKGWKMRFVDTGVDTNTGGRIKKASLWIEGETFLATYGDGLSDVNLKRLIGYHGKHGKLATITVVKPCSPFGIVGVDAHTGTVTHFEEKPRLDHWINGGFFVFNKGSLHYLRENDVLEKDTFARLLKDKQLAAYKHNGFWECMDTYKDNLRLNQLWAQSRAPWAIWKGKR